MNSSQGKKENMLNLKYKMFWIYPNENPTNGIKKISKKGNKNR